MDFFKGFKLKRELKIAQMEEELVRTQYATKLIKEARYITPESGSEWKLLGTGGNIGNVNDVSYDHYEMLEQAFLYHQNNLHAKSIVRNFTKFILGNGPIVDPVNKDSDAKKAWKKFKRINKWRRREKEIVKRVFRDGEVFIRKFKDEENKTLKVRFIRANLIKNPIDKEYINMPNLSFGIETDPDDIETPINYYLCDLQGNLVEIIPAEEVYHIKIECDSDEKRGKSLLLVAMKMLTKYAGWLDDRVALNKVRSAIALIKQVDGDKSTIESIRDTRKSQNVDSDKNKQQAFSQGTVITATKGIDYKMISPNINAPDVKDDGRAMLISVAAGVGLPEMFMTADYSTGSFASSLVAQNPFVKEIEDWRDFFTTFYEDIYSDVIEIAKEFGEVNEGQETECNLEWPTLITADELKLAQAREKLHRNMIMSKTTWARKSGLDPEDERKNLEEESKEAIFAQQFILSNSPVNQFAGGKPQKNQRVTDLDKAKEPEKQPSGEDLKPKVDINQYS